MNIVRFTIPDPSVVVESIRSLPIEGRPLRTRRALRCLLCGGSTLPLGRLLWPGAPICRRTLCEMTSLTNVTQIFRTPYGASIDQGILRILCSAVEKERILFQRQPLIDRANELAHAQIALLKWQEVYQDYTRLMHPDAWREGRVPLIPPRKLDEVLIFRASEQIEPKDPTQSLPVSVARLLKRVYAEGPQALHVPF